MDLFLITTPTGILIGRGVAPETPQVIFPGAGKHLGRVLRHLPATSGIIDAPLTLVLDTVVHCLKPTKPDEHIAAFLDCLIPVDKTNAAHPNDIWSLAFKLCRDDAYGFMARAGLHRMKLDRSDFSYKLVRGGKSSWVCVDYHKAKKLRSLVDSLSDRERTPRGLSETPSFTSSSS